MMRPMGCNNEIKSAVGRRRVALLRRNVWHIMAGVRARPTRNAGRGGSAVTFAGTAATTTARKAVSTDLTPDM